MGFLRQEKGTKAVCRSLLNSSNRHGRYRRSRIRVDTDSFDRDAIRWKINSLYDKKENLSLLKILVGEFERSSLWFCYSVYSQNFGMMVFSLGGEHHLGGY